MIVCAAVIGQAVRPGLGTALQSFPYCMPIVLNSMEVKGVPGEQNNPLYLETFQQGSGDDALRFHYIVHCSLDAIEEKRAPLCKGILQCVLLG